MYKILKGVEHKGIRHKMDINGPLYSRDWLLIARPKDPFSSWRGKKAQQVTLSLFSPSLSRLIGPGDRYRAWFLHPKEREKEDLKGQ